MMPHENVLQIKMEGTRGPLPSNPNPVSSKEGGGGELCHLGGSQHFCIECKK